VRTRESRKVSASGLRDVHLISFFPTSKNINTTFSSLQLLLSFFTLVCHFFTKTKTNLRLSPWSWTKISSTTCHGVGTTKFTFALMMSVAAFQSLETESSSYLLYVARARDDLKQESIASPSMSWTSKNAEYPNSWRRCSSSSYRSKTGLEYVHICSRKPLKSSMDTGHVRCTPGRI
jgi:hypothetical protein